MEITIRIPTQNDAERIHQVFEVTIKNNFREEGLLPQFEKAAEEEIQALIDNLQTCFESNGKKEFFLIAMIETDVVGTIAYGQLSEPIAKNIVTNNLKTGEIKSVYIHPDVQNKGIGSRLLKAMGAYLKDQNIKDFYLDSGYTKAKAFWNRKLGAPTHVLKDYWPGGNDHMIWHHLVADLLS